MKSRGWMENATLGSSSWMPCAPQGEKELMMMMMMMIRILA
jgi:hypothetical protein